MELSRRSFGANGKSPRFRRFGQLMSKQPNHSQTWFIFYRTLGWVASCRSLPVCVFQWTTCQFLESFYNYFLQNILPILQIFIYRFRYCYDNFSRSWCDNGSMREFLSSNKTTRTISIEVKGPSFFRLGTHSKHEKSLVFAITSLYSKSWWRNNIIPHLLTLDKPGQPWSTLDKGVVKF